MDVSLDGLEKWLSTLDDHFASDLSLKGLSFDRSNNKFLGLSADPSDFTVFMPSDSLKITNQNSEFPSTTQKAFKDVISMGLARKDNDTILIDIATLRPEKEYFLPGGDASVIKSLAAALKDLKTKKVVIRLLVGDDQLTGNTDVVDKRWDNPDNYENSLKKRYEEIFWATDFEHEPNASPRYSPIFDHPDITLFVGYYCPNFQPDANDESIKDVKVFLNKVIKNSLGSVAETALKIFIKDFNVDELVNQVIVNKAPSITWNHGKILAVNGSTLMTGGINYWDLYANNGPHNICDHAVKISGDAAISAHKWADYFWKYLANLKRGATDNSSFWRKADLSKSPAWNHEGTVPDSSAFQKRITEKKFPTLTVARLGDWYGAMQPIRYPVQVIDAVRDIVLNVAWQYLQPSGNWLHVIPDKSFMALAGYPFNGYLSDDYLSSSHVKYFQDLGVNPTAWASRSARTQVITSATRSIVICQQMLVDWLQNDDARYSAVVKDINSKYLAGKSTWTGSVWPFGKITGPFEFDPPSDRTIFVDLLIALAHALTNMSRSHAPEPDPKNQDFQKDAKGIYIVLTTNNTHGSNNGWDDRTAIYEFKHRLRTILNILPYEYGGVDKHKIDHLVTNLLHFKRTGTSDDKKGHDLYSHSKIVCVDGKLMYVGSDNAYPSYNEEHGVWFEDPAQINAWLGGFFGDYWGRCKVPNDLTEPGRGK